MKYQFDPNFTRECFQELVNIPSPVGYNLKMKPVFEQWAEKLGLSVSYDHKGTPYLILEGRDNSKSVEITAHLDTLGLMVRGIDSNGWLRVRQLGGVNYCTLDGESVTVFTRSGKSYTGLLMCQEHSVHTFREKARAARTEDNMVVMLDEPVSSEAEVRALGIRNGDIIDIQPRCQFTDNGYIKSRYIDDKAGVACVLTALKYLKDMGLEPLHRTLFAFPYSEEIGTGGTYVPPEVSEILALDIGLIGPGLEGSDRKVSICAKDATVHYDYELTSHLIHLAEKNSIDYAVDVYNNYGTDAKAALTGGCNLRAAAFGMGTYCTHGMERTHMDGINATTALLLSYLLEE
ncbi:MAG: M42 family metallopeptidase [Oscillospiraceae bacterium]|nr:M42 family metallopeptidase [Oscillospiraceae bacterium]